MNLRAAIVLVIAFAVLRGDDSPERKLVDLDVIAVDNHGQPVNDLTAGDFQISDANKPQKIVFFRHKDSALWQVPKLAPNEVSNRSSGTVSHATAILFDQMNESFGTRGAAADQIVRCLEGLESADDVYLYLLTMEGRIFAVHGVTAEAEGSEPGAAPWNKKMKPLLDKALRDVLRARPPEVDIAVRVQMTFGALETLGMQLSRVPGRKNVVWVTDGVPIALGPVRSDTGTFVDFTPRLRQLSAALNRSGIALYPVRQLMLGTPDGIADSPDGSPPRAGRMQGTGADTAGAGMQSLQTLDTLAEMTGGRPSAGKDTCAALKQARSDSRVSYQLGYYPPEANWDGKFHKLKITCTRKGVRVQAKIGYFAWSDEPGAGAEQAIHSVTATEFDAAEIGLRGFLVGDPKNKHLAQLTARIDARDIALVESGDRFNAQLKVSVVGYLSDGRIENAPIVPLDLHYSAGERDKALTDGVLFERNLPVPDQMAKVRFIVYDRGSNAIGSLTIPVAH